MKGSMFMLAVGAVAVAAQDISSLPPCGQTCIKNMIGIASSQLGCKVGDVTCYCTQPDFGYGVRDCANQSCSAADAQTVISFGTNYCEMALKSFSSTASSGAMETGSAISALNSPASGQSGASETSGASATTGSGSGSSAITTSAVTSVETGADGKPTTHTGETTIFAAGSVTGGEASKTGSAGSGSSAITTSGFTSVVTGADGKPTTTTGETTIFGAGSTTGSAGSESTGAAASLSSEASNLSESASAAASSASQAGQSASSAAAGQSSTGSATSKGGAAMVTAAPMLGAAVLALLAL